ncbi:exocyst complex component EXO70H1-like [Mercurialis annua]|uniref:exocyst complex component EXO70H1-like n=1 Tax=Mercurialis annua TaxID=3986 RepID=UPI002160E74C|nr:exocyst complex component EXO70H1-like [Mercurialis annua]
MVVLPETPKGIHNSLFLKKLKAISPSNSYPSSPIPSSPIIHKFTYSMMEENIENAEIIINKWALNSAPASLFDQRKEAKEFLNSVKNLRRAMHFLVSEHRASNKLVTAQNLMQIAMKRLEKELCMILSVHRDQLDPESLSGLSSDDSSNFYEDEMGADEEIKLALESIAKVEREGANAMSDLKSIADCMISAGYGQEFFKIYKIIRKSIVDEGLYLLGVEKFKASQIQKMNKENLDNLIKNWMISVKIAIKTLFSGEKTLCDLVFSASESLRVSSFYEITKEGAMHLFRFPESVAKTKKSPLRIFQLMELHEAISILWPEIELIFNSESTSGIKSQAFSSLQKLGESVRSILSEFQSTMQKDSSKDQISGGGIHPLTRIATTYISSLADYSLILSDILSDSPTLKNYTKLPESYFESPNSEDNSVTPQVSVCLAWLILVLLCKLDRKAELYKDVSLSYLFLANNLQFIIQNVCTTRLKIVLGDDWILKHIKKLKQYALNYETMAWNKVFSSLPQKPYQELSADAIGECFQKFNAAFLEAYKKQKSWVVLDGKLRDELKLSIARKLVPAYREFCEVYLVGMSGARNLEMVVRFSPDDLGNYLSDLFHGAESSDSLSSWSSLSISQSCIPICNQKLYAV